MATLSTKIALRNDTAANWETQNPVLLKGEMGVETDTRLLKVGDGSTTWVNLPYINKFEGAEPTTHTELTPTDNETDAELLQTIAAPSVDDIAIIRREIADGKTTRTAYVFDGENWAALDGNYDASNVYFGQDFIATAPIGTVTIPTSGSTTIAAKGKNLSTVLTSIFAERKTPTATKPSISVSFTNALKSVEVGTSIAPTYSTTFNAGKYTYGPATGIAAQSWEITDNLGNSRTTNSGSFEALTIGDGTSYSLTATATYNQGAMPKDNFGDDYEAARIPAGSVSATTSTKLSGYRSYFYGSITDKVPSPSEITSDLIRTSLTNGGAYNSKKELTITPGADGAKAVIVAYPANTSRDGLSEVLLTSTMGLDITASYEKQVNVEVEGVNGYDAIPYTVYMYAPAQIGGDEVHKITLK